MADFNRRKFLTTTGATALLATFPSITRALSIPAQVKTGTIKDVEHVVILMQENRSFDHYFGTLSGVRGFSDPYPAPAKPMDKQQDRGVFLQQNTKNDGPEWIAPFLLNTRQHFSHMRIEGTPHSWPDAQDAWDHGRMSHWPDAKNMHAMGYFEREDIPFQFALAEAFTLCDAYYCSAHTGTNTNRLFLWTGTNNGKGDHGGPAIGNSHDNLPENGGYPEAYTWTTYVERLQEAGINWTIYQDMSDNFTDNPLVGFKSFQASFNGEIKSDPELAKRALTTRAIDKLREDTENGTLPQVSYIIATAEGSEHPGPSSPAQGASYIADVLDALTTNQELWAKTVLFIMYDENDGFFDHMPPPAPPSKRSDGTFAGHSQVPTEGEYHLLYSEADNDLERDDLIGAPYGLGPRVPAYVISPWSRGGFVSSEVLDHTSVIRFLEQRFGVIEPNISAWRRAVCGDFTSVFDFQAPNKSSTLLLPDPRADAQMAATLSKRTVPAMPREFPIPVQENGTRPQRPNLYNPEVTLNSSNNPFSLTFANLGERAFVLHLYNHYDLSALPKRYTINHREKYTTFATTANDSVDLQIMGPEGFHRRLKMTKQQWAVFSQVNVNISPKNCSIIANVEGMMLTLNNATLSARSLAKGIIIPIPTDINGRYDFTVFLNGDNNGYMQIAGRLPA